jgi:hypothetical protein
MRSRLHSLIITLVLLAIVIPNFLARAQTMPAPVTTTCESLLPPDRPMFNGPDAPTIRFDSPISGDVFGTFVTVSMDIENFDLTPTEARHWHLWVNGQLQGMVYQPSTIIDLAPGTYQLCASLGNADHADIGQPAEAVITVYAAAAGTPTSAPAAPVGTVGELIAEPDVTPGQIALIVVVGLVAAIGGWWLGSRLPKAKK